MTKQDAMNLLQVGTITELAEMIGLARQYVSQMPNDVDLSRTFEDRVYAIAYRIDNGIELPPKDAGK